MTLFFTILRAVRMTYKAVRAAIGMALIAHGSYVWVKNKRAPHSAG